MDLTGGLSALKGVSLCHTAQPLAKFVQEMLEITTSTWDIRTMKTHMESPNPSERTTSALGVRVVSRVAHKLCTRIGTHRKQSPQICVFNEGHMLKINYRCQLAHVVRQELNYSDSGLFCHLRLRGILFLGNPRGLKIRPNFGNELRHHCLLYGHGQNVTAFIHGNSVLS